MSLLPYVDIENSLPAVRILKLAFITDGYISKIRILEDKLVCKKLHLLP